ncbi:MAG: hypothetical protein ACRD9L_07675 [Bryobacteraceae bacterium]
MVLLGFDALGSGGFFAEVQELADAAPEFRELAVTGYRNITVVPFRATIAAAEDHISLRHMYRITMYGENALRRGF